jgi:CubicO group peptidase (beta-lactamase class C family)
MTSRPARQPLSRYLILLLAGVLASTSATLHAEEAVAAEQRHSETEEQRPAATEEQLLATLRQRLQEGGRSSGMLFFTPTERRAAFAHVDQILPTRRVTASPTPWPLVDDLQSFAKLEYTVDGKRFTVADFLAMPETIGLIVVKNDRVLFEHYAPGHHRNSRWVSFSVTKSITSMLIGAAVKDGFIESVDVPVTTHVPRLGQSPYADATIRDVLQMASGVAWNEDYADPESDVARAGAANGLELVRYLGTLPRLGSPGARFNYNTGETNLAGEILRSAIGNNAASYLEERIWQPFGMEHDAHWLTSPAGGGETGGCCLSATLRDYARIGIFALRSGVLADGTQVLPGKFMADSTAPSPADPGYGYLWWLSGDGSYAAQGIFGQQIFIDPAAGLVIAAHSNALTAVGGEHPQHLDAVTALLRAAAR